MIQRIIYIIAALIFFMPEIIAQKTKAISLQWKVAGTLPARSGEAKALGVAGPVAGVHNNVLLVAGGANFPGAMPWNGGKKKYYNDVYVFKNACDSIVHHKTLSLPFSTGYAAVCSTPQGIVVAGGENENGLTDKVFLLHWIAAKENISLEDLPRLPFAVTNASAVVHNNKIYLAGGERAADVSADLLVLDLNNPSSGWQKLTTLPKPVSHTVMVVQQNGDKPIIYLLGGRKRNPGSTSDLYASVLRYNIKTNKWSEGEKLPYALSAGTGMAIGNNLLLFGGDAGETFNKAENLIAAISKETDEEKKKVLNAEKINVQASHPGFCRQVFLYNTEKKKWQKLDCLPFELPVTTTAVQWNGNVVIPSGEIKAGVRTPHILMGKFN
ncbi:MAG TPA: kelch repeat-containing protein [Flavisolibacter sp.]|nr:kelch repeat-containing protein [Flavisolibacter sp.]